MQVKTSDETAARLALLAESARIWHESGIASYENCEVPLSREDATSLLADRETAKALLARIEQVRARREELANLSITDPHEADERWAVCNELDTVLAMLDGVKEQPHG